MTVPATGFTYLSKNLYQGSAEPVLVPERRSNTLRFAKKNHFSIGTMTLGRGGGFRLPILDHSSYHTNGGFQNTNKKTTLKIFRDFFSKSSISEPTVLHKKSAEPIPHIWSNLRKTLRRSVSNADTVLINLTNPTRLHEHLEKAKSSFQNLQYQEAKKEFKKLLLSNCLDQEGKKSEIKTYLAAIYLLENNGIEAKKYLEEIKSPFLKLVMNNHSEHLIKEENKWFLDYEFYNVEAEFSEDEKRIASVLFEETKKLAQKKI